MGIDFSKIQNGDLFFTHNKSILGTLIRWCTKSDVQHVGQFIKPFAYSKLFYRCEMVQDVGNKQDLKITNPIKEKEIISIKRPLYAYKTADSQNAFVHRMIKWHEEMTISYDEQELLSHIPWLGSKKDKNKKKMICSRLVYENIKLDSGGKYQYKLWDEAVTPADLYNSTLFTEVAGWKIS